VESDRLAARLIRLLRSKETAALGRIAVDLDRANGTGPLFQPDFQLWLKMVARVSVGPAPGRWETPPQRLLAKAITADSSGFRHPDGTTLVLAHDMVPTIAALTEANEGTKVDIRRSLVPLLIGGADSSQPVNLIELPRDMADTLEPSLNGAAPLPHLVAGVRHLPKIFPVAGIRQSAGKRLAHSDLLYPSAIGDLTLRSDQRQPISWLINPLDWEAGDLELALHALVLQQHASRDVLIFTRPCKGSLLSSARHAFGRRVRTFARMSAAARAVDTPLAGFIGPGVLLHDNRSASLFSSLLSDEAVTTVTSVLIAAEGRAKSLHVSVVEGGAMIMPDGQLRARSESALIAEQMWRAAYPVAAPSSELWATRSSLLASWMNRGKALDTAPGIHLCTSQITASRIAIGQQSEPPTFIPGARSECVTKAKVLFG
jgi:hypothetical protein